MFDKLKINVLDADDLLFFERELEYIVAKTYEKKYPEIKIRNLIPVSFEVPNWAESIVYYEMDEVGEAKSLSTYSDNLPRADIKREENASPVIPIMTSYAYNINEIRKARALNMPLEMWKANVSKRLCLRKEEYYAWFGVPNRGMYGLLNNPKVSRVTVAATGTGSSTEWTKKTPQQILDDINAMLDSIFDNTKEELWPDTLLISGTRWAHIAGIRLDNTLENTILTWIKTQLEVKGITNIMPIRQLTGTGTAGANQMMAYKRDPDYLSLYVPQDFEQFEPQQKGLEYIIPCHMRTGGVILRDTVVIAIAEGI